MLLVVDGRVLAANVVVGDQPWEIMSGVLGAVARAQSCRFFIRIDRGQKRDETVHGYPPRSCPAGRVGLPCWQRGRQP